MTNIFHIVLPMFALIALGFYAARWRGFSNTMTQGLSRFLGIYALPALLFVVMAKAEIPETIEWGGVASFFIGAFGVFAFAAVWMVGLRKPRDLATVGFASSFSNIGMIGAPILLEAYGTGVAMPLMMLIVFQSPLLFTTATMLAEIQRADRGQPLAAALGAAKATVFSPMILSIAFGLTVSQMRIPMPEAAMKAAGLLAQTVLPCACFTLGASLALGPAAGTEGSATGRVMQAAVMAVLKTVVHPLFTWLLATKLLMLPPEWLAPAVTAAALPIGINAYAFAERYQASRELVSLSLLFSTLLSPVTIAVAFMVTAV